jgi:Xaa-Pro aminopeptidase
LDGVLLTSGASLAYFAGFETQLEWGPSSWLPCPAAFLWLRGERPVLFLAEGESSRPEAEFDQALFPSYTYTEPFPGIRSLISPLLSRLARVPRANLGVELSWLPSAVFSAIVESFPQARIADIHPRLAELRTIKTPSEIERIRRAVELCDCGQRAAKELAQAGMTEIELYSLIHAAMEAQAGCRVPLLADLVSGPRSAEVGGSPSSRKLCSQDLVLVDLVARRDLYWGDSCNTFAIGTPTQLHRELFDRVLSALHEAIARMRPGVRVAELDGFLRQAVSHAGNSFPHHSGHGIGVTWHEEPRIVPYSSAVFAEGMVIALEPGIYIEGHCGLRLESVVAVTSTGAETLSGFMHTL